MAGLSYYKIRSVCVCESQGGNPIGKALVNVMCKRSIILNYFIYFLIADSYFQCLENKIVILHNPYSEWVMF